MRKIYSYKEFKLNEEFIGKLVNIFKNYFKKVANELQKLENDPNKIKDYLVNNIIPDIFKQETDNFKKLFLNKTESKIYEADVPVNTTANQMNGKQNINKNNQPANQKPTTNTAVTNTDDKAFQFIDALLNKDTGVLGKQGIGLLFNDISLQGENMKTKRLSMEYIIGTVRDQLIRTLKYDQKKNIQKDGNKFIDMNYLPTFKEMLSKSNDVDSIINWVNKNIRDVMINNIKSIREDDIRAYVQKNGGASNSANYNVGDVVKYKMDGYIDGTPDEEQKNKIGEKPIIKIDGDNIIFKDNTGKEFTKTKDKIIGKAQGNEKDGQVENELKNKLGKIKNDPKKMDAINKVVDLVNQPGGVDKINKIAA